MVNGQIYKLVIEEQIFVIDDKSIYCYANNEIIEPTSIGFIQLSNHLNIKHLSEVIHSFNYKQVCQGGPMAINFLGNKLIVLQPAVLFILNCNSNCSRRTYMFGIGSNCIYLGILILTAKLNYGLYGVIRSAIHYYHQIKKSR